MSKTEFIKWLLQQKELIAIELVRFDEYKETAVYKSLRDQNNLLADVINQAQDINSTG